MEDPNARVPNMEFNVSGLPPAERLSAFRALTHTLYDTRPRSSPDAFDVASTGYRVGGLIFSQVRFSPLQFHRGPAHLTTREQDFLVLEAMIEGEQRVTMDAGQFHMQAGHVYLRDWAHCFDAEGEAMALHSVLIPRRRLEAGKWLHAERPVISWSMTEPSGRLLFALWSGLLAELDQASLPEAENAAGAFLGFIDALAGHHATEEMPATLGAMQQFLRTRLQGDIGTQDLCEHFQVSRTTVYRLFAPHGGVRKYLTEARMQRCYADLLRADPQRRSVADVAGAWGFFEPSAFSRAFKARFGKPPSAVLGTGCRKQEPTDRRGLVWPTNAPFGEYALWHREATGVGDDANGGATRGAD